MNISGKTKTIALLGDPVEHTLSPDMHNAAFENMGIDYCYVAFQVHSDMLRDAVMAVRALNMPGVNVTVPHKEKIMPFLDIVDEEASFIGAVNTVVNRQGKLTGYNTDGRGFMRSLKEENIDVEGKKAIIIGSGGAARAISYYLSEKAAGLFLYDVDAQKAENLKNDLLINRKNVFCLDSLDDLENANIVINATPLGLKSDDELPCDMSRLDSSQIVGDLVYKKTPFQIEASRIGCRTFNGLGMLLWQGVLASELWTGRMPPHEIMREVLLKKLS